MSTTSLGEWIHDRRVSQGMTQRQAATLAGCTVQQWCDLEKGRRPLHVESVQRYLPALGVRLDQAVQLIIQAKLTSLGMDLEAVIRPSLGF